MFILVKYINFPDLFCEAAPLKSTAHQKHHTSSSVHRIKQKKKRRKVTTLLHKPCWGLPHVWQREERGKSKVASVGLTVTHLRGVRGVSDVYPSTLRDKHEKKKNRFWKVKWQARDADNWETTSLKWMLDHTESLTVETGHGSLVCESAQDI